LPPQKTRSSGRCCFNDELSELKWALPSAESHAAIATHLWRTERRDALLLYIEGTDSVSHLFGHLFRARGLVGELAVSSAATARRWSRCTLARRGDYAGAMQLLDTAEQRAPGAVLVYQYRANVAFLMGDTDMATAALRHALEIEPDNALFQANLARFRAPSDPSHRL
jgi:tetratricopeptide (TPR) repeat protein